MGELPAGRLIAGWLAVLVLAVGAFGLLRLPRMPTLVVVLGFLGVPLAGLAKFVFFPRQLGSLDAMFGALPFISVAMALVLASHLLGSRHPRPSTFAAMVRRAPAFLLAWPCVVLAMSFVVLPFEPGFAAANVAINLMWFIAWIPRRSRRFVNHDSYRIAAPRERVFGFISNPANWPLYMSGVESAEVRPPGPLAVGSLIVTRRKLELRNLIGRGVPAPQSLEAVEVITRLVPGEELTSRRSDGIDATASVRLSSIDGSTSVARVSTVVMAYRLAVVGATLEPWLGRPGLRARSLEGQDRLRRLLEDEPPRQ